VVDISDENLPRGDVGTLDLGMTPQAKVRIRLGEQLGVNGPVNAMARCAALAHRRMLEHKRSRLRPVTLGTRLIRAAHGKTTSRLENVAAMWIVTLDAVHFAFDDGMVLRQMELSLDRTVAFKTGGRIAAGIDNEFSSAATTGDVETARPVARLTASLPRGPAVFETNAGVGTGRKNSGDISVALGAATVANKSGSRNLGSRC
jgi:hypothetical protein